MAELQLWNERSMRAAYLCQKYLNAHDFTFDNWKKLERLTKHHKSEWEGPSNGHGEMDW